MSFRQHDHKSEGGKLMEMQKTEPQVKQILILLHATDKHCVGFECSTCVFRMLIHGRLLGSVSRLLKPTLAHLCLVSPPWTTARESLAGGGTGKGRCTACESTFL